MPGSRSTTPICKAGRITNYAAFNGDMVPKGKACLCVEFFCVGDSPIMRLPASEVAALAIRECVDNGLIDPAKLIDTFVTTMQQDQRGGELARLAKGLQAEASRRA